MYLQISHLRLMRTLAQTGSLTKAAQHLHLTQSALSHQLKGLETHFQTRLFRRKSRPLQFTPAGQKLLDLAASVIPKMDACEQLLIHMGKGQAGRLHIAIECHSCFQWLMPTLDAYRRNWPKTELDLTQAHSFEPLSALLAGQVDLVIGTAATPDPELVHCPLFGYEALLVVAENHPLAHKTEIEAKDFATETLLTYPVDSGRLDVFSRFLQPAGVQPAQIRHVELTPMLIQLVASSRGVAVLPGWALQEYLSNGGVCARSLGVDGLWATLYASVRKAELGLPFMDAFIQQARSSSFATLEGIRQPR